MSGGALITAAGGGSPPAPAEAGARRPYYLHPGQLVVSVAPAEITTVLGSCVSVCLFDAGTGVGGMNHFVLPLHVAREKSQRFGTVAVPRLIEELLKAGACLARIRAKVFGGGSVIAGLRRVGHLGEENATLAVRLLAEACIPVLQHDLGGETGRKLVFHTDDGSAWVRPL
jgi:chemotaxis protein CheD